MKVIKRDGREVEFNKQRIREALFNAFQDVDRELTESASRKASEIANYIEKLDKKLIDEIDNITFELNGLSTEGRKLLQILKEQV